MKLFKKFIIFILIFQVLGLLGSGSLFAQEYAGYVWETPQVNPNPPQDLVTLLNTEIEKMVNAGHLTPYYIQKYHMSSVGVRGGKFWPSGLMIYWYHTGELLRAIGYAYPYLNDTLKNRVKTYVNEEINLRDPLESIYPCGSLFQNRIFRHPDTPSFLKNGNFNCWPYPPWTNDALNQGPALEVLYDLWLYAYQTNDWNYINANWTRIRDLFNAHKNKIDTYGALGGIIGFARLAQKLNQTSYANEAANLAISAMENNSFNNFLNTAIARYPDARPSVPQIGERIPVFFHLTPSVGKFLYDHKRSEIASYLNFSWDLDCIFVSSLQWCYLPIQADFMWYVTKGGIQADSGETNFNGPEIAWSVFLAQAYALKKGQSELKNYLDIPWCVGDLYFIEKLVATIEAPAVAGVYQVSEEVIKENPLNFIRKIWKALKGI